MKKHLIAAAVATAFAAPAMAQVTVYGVFDTGMQQWERKDYVNSTGATTKMKGDGIDNGSTTSGTGAQFDRKGGLSSSRLGFMGNEDLGGGMRANFMLELELNVGTGNLETDTTAASSTNVAREAKVGISSATLGGITVGRMTTGIHGVLVKNQAIGGHNMAGDVFYSTGSFSIGGATASLRMHDYTAGTSGEGTNAGTAVRMNDGAVSYSSPVFAGIQVRVDWSKQNNNQTQASNSGTTNTHNGYAISYTAGKLGVDYGNHKLTARDSNVSTKDTGETSALTGRYNLGVATVYAGMATKEEDEDGVRRLRMETQQVGIKVPYGSWTLAAQYGTGEIKGYSNAETADVKGHNLLVQYNFSKRTSVYYLMGSDEVERKKSATANTIGDKQSRDQTFLGLRHSF